MRRLISRQLTGRCLAYGRGVTYWPLREILDQHLGLNQSHSSETVLERLGDRSILGLTLGLDVAGDLHPLEARESLHEAWVELLGEFAAEGPCVMLVEDLHWAEEPLLDLFERLLREVRGPVFLMGTARPELLARRPTWAGGLRNAASLWLEPLSQDEAASLVESLLGTELTPLLSELLDRAEGNPFFVEELLSTLIDTGVIGRENGDWVARQVSVDPIVPDSIQATLAARIDLLPAREKAALQAASVAGRVFWASPVAELLGDEPDYALLEQRDFVHRRPTSSLAGEREFAIKHALTREVAYASLPKARRARLHAALATWIERAGGGRDEHAPFLAHHYAEAVRPEDADLVWVDDEQEHASLRVSAGTWLRRAAELANSRYEIDDALALLQRALELEDGEATQAELWLAIGRAHTLRYDGEAFHVAMEKAIALSTDPELTVEACSELAFLTAFKFGMWRRKPDPDLVDGWIERALALSEGTIGSERVKSLVARACWDPTQADAADEAKALAERIGSPELNHAANSALHEVAFLAGRYAEAVAHTDAELRLIPEIASPDDRALIYWDAAVARLGCGQIGEARRLALLHDEILRRLTPHQVVHGIGLQLVVEEHAGCWEAIHGRVEEVEAAVSRNIDTPCMLNPRSLLGCALAAAYAGDDDEASRLEQAAEAVEMEGYGLTIDAPRLRLAVFREHLVTVQRLLDVPIGLSFGDLSARAARLDGLVALHDAAGVEAEAPALLRPGSYLEPFALRALGLVREDAALIEQATARFEAMGLDWHIAQTRRLVGVP